MRETRAFRQQTEGWMVTAFFVSETFRVSVSSRRPLIAPGNRNVKAVAAFYPLPSPGVVLGSSHVVYRKLCAESCLSTRVAPEPTYSFLINGIGCVPAGAVNAATVSLFSPDNP
jgi:hypothetical protein